MELKNEMGALVPLLLGKDKLPKEEMMPLALLGGTSSGDLMTLLVAFVTKQKVDSLPQPVAASATAPPPAQPTFTTWDARRAWALERIASVVEFSLQEQGYKPPVHAIPPPREREAAALERIAAALEWYMTRGGEMPPPTHPTPTQPHERVAEALERITRALEAFASKSGYKPPKEEPLTVG